MVVVEGDMLPKRLPLWNLVVAREDDEDWSVGLRCPCGCGQRLEMLLLKGVKPRWDISVNLRGHVSLHPSVWVRRKPIALLGSRGKSFGANNADNGSLMLSERGRVIKTSA